MNIFMYKWKAYNQKDVENAILSLGHRLTFLTNPIINAEKDDEYTDMVEKLLQKNKCDCLFSINYFPVLAKACHNADIMYISWNCDSPLLAMYNESIFYDTNMIFTFDYSNYEEFKHLGVSNIFHLPLAPLDISSYLSADFDTTHNYKYNVSFIGSMYRKNSYDKIAPKLPDYLCGYLDGSIRAQTQISCGNLLEKLLTPQIIEQLDDITDFVRSDDSFADTATLFSTTVLGFKSASQMRINYLNHLSRSLHKYIPNCRPDIFTDDDVDDLIFCNIHPKVDYHTEMPLIFRDSKININMTIPNIKTGIPLRCWDIIASHGFLLTDFRQEYLDYFVPGQDIIFYENADDFVEKAIFYLTHDDCRNKIKDAAYKKVDSIHTCQNRVKKIFEICFGLH